MKKKDRARYPESEGYRIADGAVWRVENVFVSWGNFMSVHVAADGNTLRFYQGLSPDLANLTATVRRSGTIENWVEYLERRHFQGMAVPKEAYLGGQVGVTVGDVTWHRHLGEEPLLDRELTPESFILFSVMILGDITGFQVDEEQSFRRRLVYKLGAFEAWINLD